MKSIVGCILASILLVQSFMPRAALSLLQSSDVWSHYYEHQQEQQQPLNFFDFLWMHYSADSEHTKQKKHHLPSFDFHSVASLFVLPSLAISFEHHPMTAFFDEPHFRWLNLYNFQSLRVLMCPPRA